MSTSESLPPAALASGSSAEAQAAAFADDPRVHFDRTAGTWRFEQDDGTELEYDDEKGAWVPVVRPQPDFKTSPGADHPATASWTRTS